MTIMRRLDAESGEPIPVPEFAILYRRAFDEFGAAALWSSRPVANPTRRSSRDHLDPPGGRESGGSTPRGAD